jgi:MFS family permease
VSSGLRPRDARWLAGGFLLFLASSFGQTFFVSLFAADLRAEHGLSHGAFGGLYTAATLVSALALTATGHVVDRRSARAVALWAVPALAAGAAVMAAASHVAALLVAVLLLRFFGQGMLTHLSFTLMGRWFTAERGRAVSTATLGLNTGEALLPVLVVGLVAVVGWRGVWWLAAAALVVVAAVLAGLFAQERTPAAATAAPSRPPVPSRTRREALRDPYFHLVVLAVAAPALIGNTVFFHQMHLVELRGWSLTAQASAFSVYAVTTVASNLIGGRLVDRLSALAMLPFFLLPLAGGLLVLAGVDAQWAVFGFMALYGVTNGLSLSMFGATWPEIYGVDHLGAIRSVVVAVLVFASAAGPGLCGLLIDAGVGLPLQIAVLGGYCLAASALMLVVTRRLRARLSA